MRPFQLITIEKGQISSILTDNKDLELLDTVCNANLYKISDCVGLKVGYLYMPNSYKIQKIDNNSNLDLDKKYFLILENRIQECLDPEICKILNYNFFAILDENQETEVIIIVYPHSQILLYNWGFSLQNAGIFSKFFAIKFFCI